jgi:hypothetical protein
MAELAVKGIAKNFLTRFDARSWLTKDLKRGDLHSLVDVASGLRPDGLTDDQADRLMARGMVRAYGAISRGLACATRSAKAAASRCTWTAIWADAGSPPRP